jgi:hypothetical protein
MSTKRNKIGERLYSPRLLDNEKHNTLIEHKKVKQA